MIDLERRLYGVIVRLHPADFRNEFGREMTLDFEDALESTGFAALYFDALLSLGRQWTVRAFPSAEEQGYVTRPSLLAGQYVMVSPGGPSLFELARASVLATMLFFAIGFSATISNKAITNDHQSAPSSQDGTVQSGADHRSSTGGKAGRTAGQADREYSCIRSYDLAPCDAAVAGKRSAGDAEQSVQAHSGALDHDWQADGGSPERQRADVKGAEEQGSRVTARTLSSVRPVWRAHPGQLIALAVIAWLTTLLLRRNPSMVRKLVLAALGLLAMAAPLAFGLVRMIPIHAQTAAPQLEVATVRPSDPAKEHLGLYWRKPDGFKLEGTTLRGMIAYAYSVPGSVKGLVQGGPAWMLSDAFDVQVKVDPATTERWNKLPQQPVDEERRSLERALLTERFQLKLHREMREMPAFVLTVAKGGSKLQTPVPEKDLQAGVPQSRINFLGRGHWQGHFALLSNLSRSLTTEPEADGRPVVDKTGLTGQYDFTLHWTPVDPGPGAAPTDAAEQGPSLFTALEEQLGLKLTPAKEQIEVIVVDSVEKPSEN
ncbi:MAG TPA: TIGR03435 family protein [Granulicella sp.]|jgi:uncharacterized protein (TIGR03435 family)